ncbi:Xaa-Pro aminopeptidase OS=Lysinibacillus sphaericus OX=1421 GN=LS41612_20790 PE=3 SV=1 [Lysinibacillus sphaericus]
MNSRDRVKKLRELMVKHQLDVYIIQEVLMHIKENM